MDRIAVSSSNIASVGYDPASFTLEVEFNSGKVYDYSSVPQSVYDEFMAADSKGKYFIANVKNQYDII